MKERFGGMSFVAFRGHIVKTCSLPKCLSLCDYLWEQLILSSLDLFCKPNFSNCSNALWSLFACMQHNKYLSEWMETDWFWIWIWILYFVHKKSLLWSRGDDRTWVVTYFVKKDSVLSHVFGTICVLSSTLIFSFPICWALMRLLCWVSNEYQTIIWFTWMASIYTCYCRS